MAKVKTFNDQMEEQYGDDVDKVIIKKEEDINLIPTGSFSLDASLGGGIPKRRFSVVYGPEGSGKSTLAVSVAKNAILRGDRVLYIDVENQMHFSYIETLLGMPIGDQFILAKPMDSDDAFVMLEKAIESKEFGLIILDSIAALSPPEEQKKEFDEGNMAITPRDLAKFFRRNSFKVRDNDVAVLFINQVRDLVGSYVHAFTMPGGHALLHYSSVIVLLSKGKEMKIGEETIGILTKFVVKKNKLAPPFRTFMFPIIFGIGVDTLRDMIDYSETLGVIRKGGPYYKFGDITLGRGMIETMNYLEANPEALDNLKKACYNVVGKYKQEEIEEEEFVE